MDGTVEDGSAAGERAVLFLHTATLPPLGADTWVHVQLLTKLDRATHDLHMACATGSAAAPTPTYQAVHDIQTSAWYRPTSVRSSRTEPAARIGALIATLPALATMVRLTRHVRRHRIRLIHTSDRPRRHAGRGPSRAPDRGDEHRARARRLCPLDGPCAALVAAAGGRARRDLQFVGRTLVEGGHRADRIHVVLNAIDPTTWEPGVGRDEARQEFDVGPGAPVVITVCRLFPGKGPAELIHAIAVVRHEYPDVKLLVVGSDVTGGVFEAELAELVEHLGVERNVTFTGRRSDVRRLMAAAICTRCRRSASRSGWSSSRRWRCGLPVVAARQRGTPEVVEHGKTGLLSSPGDVDAVAQHLLTLMRWPDLRAGSGARAGQG